MQKSFFTFFIAFILLSVGTNAQQTLRYYVAYSICFCDSEVSSISSNAKPGYHLFISEVESANTRSPNGQDNSTNKDKIKDRFRDQVKIDYKNWTEVANAIFVSDFSTEQEAIDYRRKKMADEKTSHETKIITVSF